MPLIGTDVTHCGKRSDGVLVFIGKSTKLLHRLIVIIKRGLAVRVSVKIKLKLYFYKAKSAYLLGKSAV